MLAPSLIYNELKEEAPTKLELESKSNFTSDQAVLDQLSVFENDQDSC